MTINCIFFDICWIIYLIVEWWLLWYLRYSSSIIVFLAVLVVQFLKRFFFQDGVGCDTNDRILIIGATNRCVPLMMFLPVLLFHNLTL